MAKDRDIMIWPQYLNNNLSRCEGRKVSLEYAIKDPTVNEISRALKRLNITHNVEKDKAYPGKWYDKSGRVLSERTMDKNELLKQICIEIKAIRK
ncbi:MAG: signal recognition particle subunit SRP19/SEC65 family protein [Methanobrevibacter sp.]|uniref:signal recognition particle subunit SRP19/SEC65 family protein n=1 Tax=Methanobrevibacter sp. TaxID=66852 RepID=UPI0026DF438F|nr:signal recognition particle subunit SRP19/SEC65 family protein [Methanobrevibacter sp.]MDO5848698.1 signal recognition particle subunit SRP19/SEC65 family protein [Methanobrevibacter sp.]